MDNKKVCVIVPFYNEENSLPQVLQDLTKENYSVVAIDDGSTDNSFEIASKFPITLLKHVTNFGQGAAIQTGISFSRLNPKFDYFVTFDSDGQHQVEEIKNVLEPLIKNSADFVFGTRFQDKLSKLPIMKRIILKLAILYTKASTGIELSDTHNGFRALNRKAISEINLNFSNMTHASEFIEQAYKSNLRVEEIPVNILYTKYSKRKGQSIWNSVNILVDLFLR